MSARRIIDPHIHLWDQLGTPRRTSPLVRALGWSPRLVKAAAEVVFPRDIMAFFGASPDVLGDYLPVDHRADVGAWTLAATVHVQAGWEGRGPMGPVGETAWLDGLEGGPAGIVGHADLTLGQGVDAVLEGHQRASARFRGVRHMLAHHPSKAVHDFAARPRLAFEAEFLRGVGCLEARGLSFDAWCYHHQLGDVAYLAEQFPEMTIVLCHLGTPVAVGGEFGGLGRTAEVRREVFARWADDLAWVASFPNVVAKISGLAMPVLGWGYHTSALPVDAARVADDLGPLVAQALDVFGVERCMFASNFPVDRVSVPYAALYGAYEVLSADLGAEAQEALFCGNAARVYRLGM